MAEKEEGPKDYRKKRNALESCLRHAREGSAILFLEDGVLALIQGAECAAKIEQASSRYSLYALRPDLEARGIPTERLIGGVTLVDYHGFVDLAVSCDRVQSWL